MTIIKQERTIMPEENPDEGTPSSELSMEEIRKRLSKPEDSFGLNSRESSEKTRSNEEILQDIQKQPELKQREAKTQATQKEEAPLSATPEHYSPDLKSYVESNKLRDSGKPRRPVWEILNDPGEKAVLERRAFLEKLAQDTAEKKAKQEAILAWNRAQKLREERRQKALEEQQRQQEIHPGFLARVRNFFKERTEELTDFLSEPNREVQRIREVDRHSLSEWKGVFKEEGQKLRRNSGFLRRLAARFNLGNKPAVASGVPAPTPESVGR